MQRWVKVSYSSGGTNFYRQVALIPQCSVLPPLNDPDPNGWLKPWQTHKGRAFLPQAEQTNSAGAGPGAIAIAL